MSEIGASTESSGIPMILSVMSKFNIFAPSCHWCKVQWMQAQAPGRHVICTICTILRSAPEDQCISYQGCLKRRLMGTSLSTYMYAATPDDFVTSKWASAYLVIFKSMSKTNYPKHSGTGSILSLHFIFIQVFLFSTSHTGLNEPMQSIVVLDSIQQLLP